jgi:membrane protease YdiL (CAAX protease family)
LTVDGIEATLAVDVVGPFLLTTLLRDRLDAARARVVTLTGIYQRKGQIAMDDLSFAHRPYDWLAANNQAQRGRWLFMSELARRAPHLTTAAVHPGAVLTGAQARLPRMVRAFIHTLARPGFVRPEVGAIPVLRLAADPDLPDVSGRFFDRCRRAPDVADPALAQAFWAACEQMIGERWSSEMPQRSNRDASWSRGRGPTVFQQREDGMSIEAFINRHPVLAYYALTFAISWGGFVLVVGPGGFASTSWQTEGLFLPAIMAMLAGPSIAGVLLTGIVSGRAGLREVLSRLLLWRVAARWYAMALLPAPLLAAAVLFALSLTSPIFTTDDKAAVLLAAIAAGFTTVFEEIGWTGFAVPRLRLRHGVFATGLIVGVLWGAWHLLQQLFISGTYSGRLPLILYLPLAVLAAITQLTAYRVLMVWLYDRTGSLLVTTLMHASLTASTIFIFTPVATGLTFLTYGWVLAAALWVVVAAVALATGGLLSRQPQQVHAA